MATWGTFAQVASELAEAGLRLFNDSGQLDAPLLAYLATLRSDGAPRLHPVCPVIGGGGLFVFVNPRSPKRFDLLDDSGNRSRYALHAPLGASDEEFVVSGVAALVRETARRAAATAAARHPTHASDLVFEFDIVSVLWGVWRNVGQPNTYAEYRRWPTG